MPTDKASYLAAHYLSTDTKPPSKKRKRKHHTTASGADGLVIQDDDEPGWTTASTSSTRHDDDDPDGPVTVAGTSAEFRRAKKSAWKTIGGGAAAATTPRSSATAQQDDTAAAADAIIASAAAEQATAAREADGDPDPDPDPPNEIPMMSDGTHAGLQSAAAISAQLRARQQAERADLERMKAERATNDTQPELVLRDATGRRVDAAMRRAEMRRAAAEAERAKEQRKRALKGEVQLDEARRRREALEDAALMPLARGKNDEAMNAELKAAQRWNDPMAQFLGGDDDKDSGRVGTARAPGASGNGKARRPVYKGAAPPNRYGIRPGYRWDGVNRGNGFEAERFKAINRRERNKGLDYAWQMDE